MTSCFAGDRLRTVMSSVMRRRKGLISAIGEAPVLRIGLQQTAILSDGSSSLLTAHHHSRDSGFVQSLPEPRIPQSNTMQSKIIQCTTGLSIYLARLEVCRHSQGTQT